MTKREKILFALICVGGIYAAADYGWNAIAKSAGLGAPDRIGEARKAITEMGSSLSAATLGSTQLHVLKRSVTPAVNDAFEPLRKPEEKEAADMNRRTAANTLAYTGFLQMGRSAMAIIAGMEYSQGDTIPATGDIIREITPSRVKLFSPTGNIEWELPYTGDEL